MLFEALALGEDLYVWSFALALSAPYKIDDFNCVTGGDDGGIIGASRDNTAILFNRDFARVKREFANKIADRR